MAQLAAEPYQINSCEKLYAVYFNNERQLQPTIDYLVDKVHLKKEFATAAVTAINLKLSKDVL